jgi:hypothetical protein
MVGLKAFKPLMVGEGLSRGLIRGFKVRVGKCLTGITRRETEAAEMPGSGGIRRRHSRTRRRGRRKRRPTGGARITVIRERKGVTTGMHKPEEKASFTECAKASQAGWAERRRHSLRGKAGRRGVSWAGSHERIQMELFL